MRDRAHHSDEFRLDIQGLRGIAVLLVVLYHARFSIPQTLEFGGGFVGVDVFFVISGFVVGGSLYRELEKRGSISVRRFVARRARRLFPAAGVAVSATLILSLFAVSLEFLSSTIKTGLAATFFGANIWLWTSSSDYFAQDNSQNPLLHTWSLSVEEQFYILFTFAILALIWTRSRRGASNLWKNTVFTAGLLFALSLAYSLMQFSSDQTTAFYSPLARAWQFLLGVLLYLLFTRLASTYQNQFLAAAFWLLGFSLIAYSAVFFSDNTPFPGVNALLPSVGAALVISSGSFSREGPGVRILRIPPLVSLGNISYSWYLWHWPFIVFADFWWKSNDEAALAAAVLALIPASLSFRLIEQRFREHGRNSRFGVRSLLTVSFLIPALTAAGAHSINELAFQRLEENDSFLATIRIEQRQIEGNLGSLIDSNGGLDYVIVGDSHAATFAQGLSVAAAAQNESVGVISQGRGCLLLEGPFTGTPDEACNSWQEDALGSLRNLNVKTVVLHGYATGRLTGYNRGNPYQYEISDKLGTQAQTLNKALTLYEEGLRGAVASLVESGKQVVILSTLPDFNRPLPTDLPENRTTAYEVFLGTYPEVAEEDIEAIPLEVAQSRNQPLLEIERKIADEFPGVRSVDLSPYSCLEGICTQWRDGVLLYSDMDHITSVHALRLSETLLTILGTNYEYSGEE